MYLLYSLYHAAGKKYYQSHHLEIFVLPYALYNCQKGLLLKEIQAQARLYISLSH